MAPTEKPAARKKSRITQACDLCHRRSIRCRQSVEAPLEQCQNCYDFQVECTFNRPSGRRSKNPEKKAQSPPNLLPSQKLHAIDSSRVGGERPSTHESSAGPSRSTEASFDPSEHGSRTIPQDALGVAWYSFAIASSDAIRNLLEIFMYVVYPIFPLVHGPSMFQRLRSQEHLQDRAFFASVMAACALAAARARDGAAEGLHYFEDGVERRSEIFFAAAQDAIPRDLAGAQSVEFLRTCALLSITALQYGQVKVVHLYHGYYCTLVTMHHFHDETQWPQDMTQYQVQDRRRLFWCMYNFDIYLSVVFDCAYSADATYANVAYPREMDDEDFAPNAAAPSGSESWMTGWNFVTNLYRILEWTRRRMRYNPPRTEIHATLARLFMVQDMTEQQIMTVVFGMYNELPERFKQFNVPMTGDRNFDIFGFQIANIHATLHLVQMAMLTAEAATAGSVQRKCSVVETVLRNFRSIEPRYLQAMNRPFLYHLSAIGKILTSLIERSLTEDVYRQVRELLVSLAELLGGLESGLRGTNGASSEIRLQVQRMDQYMQGQRRSIAYLQSQESTAVAGPSSSVSGHHAQRAQHGQHQQPLVHEPQQQQHADMMTEEEFQIPTDLPAEWPFPFDLAEEHTYPARSAF